jgi:hypothetical protein
LSDYAEITKNLDVDSIVSEMTPMIYESPDGLVKHSSFDPAIYEEDWINSWKRMVGENKQGSTRQVFQAAQELLKYYEQELGYDLDEAAEFLKERLGVLPLTGRKSWAIKLSA